MLFAIPGFFLLIAVELVAARWLGRQVYRLNDAISSIGLGVLSQISGVFSKALQVGIYAVVLQQVALFELPVDSPWVWISGLLLYDFCYYWLHRAGHEVNLLWAAHVVHHQSERYNLSTALRQSSSGALFGWIFYLPMALLGFPLEVFAVVAVIDLLYQYWIHTELVPKLGWFDRVFASPSNHRAHHAVNMRYLDRNYGGLLILWDRLFGTFVEEDERDPPVYGTRAPLRSFNPLWANLEVYAGLLRDTLRSRSWGDRFKLWFARPGWRPADVQTADPKPEFDIARSEFNPTLPPLRAAYVLLQFIALLGAAVLFLMQAANWSLPAALAYAFGLILSLTTLGVLLEDHPRAAIFEALRLFALALSGVVLHALSLATTPSWLVYVLSAFAAVSLLLLWLSQARHATPPRASSAGAGGAVSSQGVQGDRAIGTAGLDEIAARRVVDGSFNEDGRKTSFSVIANTGGSP
jgi:sterol desaturase/sphingolipid hydroxylase (fatty acid hydroxylase superfamily)